MTVRDNRRGIFRGRIILRWGGDCSTIFPPLYSPTLRISLGFDSFFVRERGGILKEESFIILWILNHSWFFVILITEINAKIIKNPLTLAFFVDYKIFFWIFQRKRKEIKINKSIGANNWIIRGWDQKNLKPGLHPEEKGRRFILYNPNKLYREKRKKKDSSGKNVKAVKTIDRRKNVTGYFKYKPLKDRNRVREREIRQGGLSFEPKWSDSSNRKQVAA